MSLLPGNRPGRTRFRLIDLMPKGTLGGGNEKTQIGDGADVPLKVYVPTAQTANALEVRTPAEGLVFAISAGGSATEPQAAISASGAVSPHVSDNYIITKAGVAALTLAAPTAGTDDGVTITLTSATANAHTLTATGLLNTGSASVNVATFAAHAGASVKLQAYQGTWNALAQIAITFS
jgi:hypothetical protein